MINSQETNGGYGDKFRLLTTVATDPRTSGAHSAVMGVILWRFNRDHGCAWPSIDSLALDAGIDSRTVQRALASLEGWGYLHTVRHKGGLNRYVPHFQQAQRALRSNGLGAAREGAKGRHSRRDATPSSSQGDGTDVVTPTAYMPPEYLNESIPKREKEKGEFSFLGNRENESGGGTSDTSPASEGFPQGSPEKSAETGFRILQTSIELAHGHLPDRHERLDAMKAKYLQRCQEQGKEPDARVLDMFEDKAA